MKRNDFLQNLLLIILSAVLAACIVNLACLGALPVTYTSRVQVQITGDDLHVRDVREFAGYIESDEALRNKVKDVLADDGAAGSADITYNVAATAHADTGIIDVYVRSDDPYTSHDIAEAIVETAYSDYPTSHTGIFVNLVEAASVAYESDPLPVTRYTIFGAVLGMAFGALLSYLAVKGEREKKRREKTQDPRFAKIEEPDEQAYDELFAEDNEDVDPEMRELYKVTKRAGVNSKVEVSGEKDDSIQEGHMSAEAEAAYLEAMEIEAMAADEEERTAQVPTSGTVEGGDSYEA